MNLFEGQLVRLTQIERSYLEAYKRWFRNYETQRLVTPDVIVPVTDEVEDAFYEEVSKAKDQYIFGIKTLEDDRLIGNCSLFKIDNKNRSAELGILIGEPDYRGKGFGTDAMQVLLRFAFTEANLNRVSLHVFGYNEHAIRAYEKIGFVHEGRERQAIWRENAYRDVVLMAILREEWQATSPQ